MKKVISLILCLFMLVTALPAAAFAAEEENVPEATVFPQEVFSEDNMPVSLEEVRTSTKYNTDLYLHKSVKNFEISVRLTDGGVHKIDGTNPLEIYYEVWLDEIEESNTQSNYNSYEAYLQYVEETHNRIKEENNGNAVAFGKAYVKGEEALSAANKGEKDVTVYVRVDVYEFDAEAKRYMKTNSETLSFKKACTPYYAKITPLSGMPQYRCQGAESINFDNAVFEIEYYGGETVQRQAVYTKTIIKKQYELDGKPLNYTLGRGDSRFVLISFYDTEYIYEAPELMSDPFSDLEINSCVFEGEQLAEITYTVTYKDETKQTYTKPVLGDKTDPNGEYLDYIYDYSVRVRTGKYSDKTTIVSLKLGGVGDYTICGHASGKFFPDLIAKITAIFQEFIYRFRVWFTDVYY